ncbi:4-hydroxy-2-oxoheptanedioate aldolase [Bordetella bronchialis]|uniref:2,4-dihydroxyhept-2-ene-1,7-dioic acid aldolase n=1 Tax=Bordetella bronchialis TaxID=463025 RepID=A0A193FG13_9BORD|nr:4-hydroxy-2-oxoheptanedioate aldolase [Bordetella bronchialis]ANN66570.1 2,4-dihydroxyhept-2-ene-1,7-dioic acid aldolase [Bordetella bronchialis]ANN71648.1 2,4-dihydroxyhept-2-ene-1,7-dioic acid aldolase [Bordetella bronchialis]
MDILSNSFKRALREGKPQIALWTALTHPYAAEICAGAGFDCLVIDGEHAPNELQSMLAQLQSVAAYPVAPVVRPPWNDFVRIKQILDIGAQNLLIPMIQSAEEAAAAVAAVRYPPAGIRGVGAALARSSRWNRIPDYLRRANDEMCVLLQIETPAGLAALDDILAIDGVDGVFIGPADLSANMGHLDNPGHPEVTAAIDGAIRRIVASGKAAGILHTNPERARHYLSLGATFVAVGIDATLLARAAESLAAQFDRRAPSAGAAQQGPY